MSADWGSCLGVVNILMFNFVAWLLHLFGDDDCKVDWFVMG